MPRFFEINVVLGGLENKNLNVHKMSYISECSICSKRETKRCPVRPVYDATNCSAFHDTAKLRHLSGPMRLVFWLYFALVTISVIFGVVFTIITPVPMAEKTLSIVVGFVYLLSMIYAIIAFIKPLSGGAFITIVLTITFLISSVILLIGLIIKGNYMLAGFAALWLTLDILLFCFLIKDDELEYLFPKDIRKVHFLDYLFAVIQLLWIAATVLVVSEM